MSIKRVCIGLFLAALALLSGTACDEESSVSSVGIAEGYRIAFHASNAEIDRVRLLVRQDEVALATWEGGPNEICNIDFGFTAPFELLALGEDSEGHLLASAQEFLTSAIQGYFRLELSPLPAHEGFAMPAPGADLLFPYIRWSLQDYDGATDENGIPLNAFVRGVPGPVYHPLYVAQIALAKHGAYATGQGEHYRDEFLFLADWLMSVANAYPEGYCTWTYGFAFKWLYLDYQPPWYSGLAQGEIIAVLIRAQALTGDPAYGELADRAVMAFHRTCEQAGGMAAVDRLGYHTPEEYPGQPSNHVLNGMMLMLFGILDHYQATGDPHSEALYRRGVAYLVDRLHVYDTGYWSLYDAYRSEEDPGALVTEFYHQLHIDLLDLMYAQTGLSIFQEYADRFRSYQ